MIIPADGPRSVHGAFPIDECFLEAILGTVRMPEGKKTIGTLFIPLDPYSRDADSFPLAAFQSFLGIPRDVFFNLSEESNSYRRL